MKVAFRYKWAHMDGRDTYFSGKGEIPYIYAWDLRPAQAQTFDSLDEAYEFASGIWGFRLSPTAPILAEDFEYVEVSNAADIQILRAPASEGCGEGPGDTGPESSD